MLKSFEHVGMTVSNMDQAVAFYCDLLGLTLHLRKKTDDGSDLAFLDAGDGQRLAYRKRDGRGPTLVFLPGYASDMEGSKAVALDAVAAKQGLDLLRFDYSGTGASEGVFEGGTLARWLDDAPSVK